MPLLSGTWATLAWLGRRASVVIAIGVFAGLAIPPLAGLLRPLLIPGILVPFLVALLRLDWGRMRARFGEPGLAVLQVVWLLLAAPVLVDVVLRPFDLPLALHNAMVLTAAASPLMASASLALILGLDAALAMFLIVLTTALMPLTVPAMALWLLDVDVGLGLVPLTLRLAALVSGCFLAAWLLRRVLPPGWTKRHAAALDGLAVVGLLVVAIGLMDGVSALLATRPGYVLGCAVAAYGLNLSLQALAAALFAWRGRRHALTLGLLSGNPNLAILLAALADRASFEFVLFIAMAQFPIYTLPLLQRPLYRYVIGRARGGGWPDPEVDAGGGPPRAGAGDAGR